MGSSYIPEFRESALTLREDMLKQLPDGVTKTRLLSRFDEIVETCTEITRRLKSGLADNHQKLAESKQLLDDQKHRLNHAFQILAFYKDLPDNIHKSSVDISESIFPKQSRKK